MERSAAPAERWLLSRVDRRAIEAVAVLLQKIAEQLATATADGVSVRRLSADGRLLFPLAAHHPDAERREALGVATAHTLDRNDGLWKTVIDGPRAVRWHLPVGEHLAGVSKDQAQFLARFPVRAILAAPLVHDGVVLGGVALVRFSADVPYTDQDEELLIACARRIAAAVSFQARIEALAATHC